MNRHRTSRLAPGSGEPGRFDRAMELVVQVGLVVLAILLVSSIAVNPTKRGIQMVAGVVALAIGYLVRPVIALCCAICLVPFPLQTSIASTTTLIIFAVGVLMLTKVRPYGLGSPFVASQVDFPIMALVFMMLISASQLRPDDWYFASRTYVSFAGALTLYYLTIQVVRTQRDLEIALKSLMAVAAIVGVIGTLQTLFPERHWLPAVFRYSIDTTQIEVGDRKFVRVYATFPGISSFGEFVGTSILILYVLLRQAKSVLERTFWLAAIVVLLIALAGSATRMGLIILVFGFVYMIFMGRGAIPRAQLIQVVFVTMFLGLLGASTIAPITDRMMARMETLGTKDSSVQSRWGVMEQAFDRIPDSPIVGHGVHIPYGTFEGHVTANIHNLYLTLAYTIGIPGLIAFVWFAAVVYRRSLATVRDRRVPPAMREYLLVLHTSFVMFLIYQLTSDYVTHSIHMNTVWLRTGLLMAADLICRRMLFGTVR